MDFFTAFTKIAGLKYLRVFIIVFYTQILYSQIPKVDHAHLGLYSKPSMMDQTLYRLFRNETKINGMQPHARTWKLKHSEVLNHYGLFCRLEDKRNMHNKVIHTRFRLGNSSYVDYLEGKNHHLAR
jgi:hypothetical protein